MNFFLCFIFLITSRNSFESNPCSQNHYEKTSIKLHTTTFKNFSLLFLELNKFLISSFIIKSRDSLNMFVCSFIIKSACNAIYMCMHVKLFFSFFSSFILHEQNKTEEEERRKHETKKKLF